MITEEAKFNPEEKEEYLSHLNGFLKERGWVAKEKENKTIFKKENSQTEGSFLEAPKKKKLPSVFENIIKMENFFRERGFEKGVKSKLALNGEEGESFLIVAGIQYFRGNFWDQEISHKAQKYIPQPVVRTQYFGKIREGFTSSFVNPTTAIINSSIQDHLENLDCWFDLFSKLGLYIGNMTLEIIPSGRYAKNKKGIWSKTDGLSLRVNYFDLNLGDAGFIKIPKKGKDLNVSDVGFGLERILWALYKNPSYFNLLGPEIESEQKKYNLIDNVRTATLLTMGNVTRKDKDAFRQYRKFTKELAKEYGNFDLYHLVEHNHEYWSYFLKTDLGVKDTYKIIRKEIENERRNL